MRGGWRCRWRLILLVVALATLAPFAYAQAPAELEIAKRAFEDGVALEKKGDYAGALGKFRESAQIKTTLGNRFHTAYCLEMTGKLAAALLEYEAIDKAAREQQKPEIVEQTRVRLEPLRPRVPQVMLRVMFSPPLTKDAKDTNVPGVEVLIDGSPIAPALLDGSKPARVDPGDHVVTAHAPDYENFTKKISTAESGTLPVDVVLERSAVAANANSRSAQGHAHGVVTDPPSEAPRAPSRTLAIAATAGAVVLATTGVVAFIVAGSAASDAETTCPTKVSCDDERSKVRTFDALALGGFVGAVGLGALSVVLWVSKPSGSASTSTSTSTPTSTSSSSRFVARPGFVGMEGRF
jgi:hypothetical protein